MALRIADNRPFLYPPTPQSIQKLLDTDGEPDRPKTILRHALSFAVSHADVELTTWLTSVQGEMVSTPSPRIISALSCALGGSISLAAGLARAARTTPRTCFPAPSLLCVLCSAMRKNLERVTVVCERHSGRMVACLDALAARG